MPDSTLPDSTLPDSTLPDSTLPDHDPTLTALGWNDHTAAHWPQAAAAEAQPARVVRVDRGLLTVRAADGEHRLPLSARLRDVQPAVGDWAAVSPDSVVALLERRNALLRRETDRSATGQVIAANVDLVLVAVPLTEQVRARKLERYLAFARSSEAEALVVLTKCDLYADLPTALDDARRVSGEVPVHAVSVVTGDGIAGLTAALSAGATVVVVGPSGAGKSTLANALGADREQQTGAIRADGRGRHTTTARELVRLAGGALLIDTPGLRALELWDAGEAISGTYAEILELAASCRFSDCSHDTEPGCAVNDAIVRGTLSADRVEGYAKLQREQERLAARVDNRLRAERTRQLRARHRQLRNQRNR